MAAIADDAPPSMDALAAYQRDGRSWVATDSADQPIAYILVKDVDGYAHIEQVTVHPTHARKGVGRALIEEVARWAVAGGLEGITLATFREVPWNAPYYERLGFAQVPAALWHDGLRQIMQLESDHGLSAWPRVAMKKMLAEEPSNSKSPATRIHT